MFFEFLIGLPHLYRRPHWERGSGRLWIAVQPYFIFFIIPMPSVAPFQLFRLFTSGIRKLNRAVFPLTLWRWSLELFWQRRHLSGDIHQPPEHP
jgi:hypothetical protein